jgi:hypothetical protein
LSTCARGGGSGWVGWGSVGGWVSGVLGVCGRGGGGGGAGPGLQGGASLPKRGRRQAAGGPPCLRAPRPAP